MSILQVTNPMNLTTVFRRALEASGVINPGDAVVLGVSGGPDSMTLMHLAASTHHDLGIHPTVVHVHHGLRGPSADADQHHVCTMAKALDLPCVVCRVEAGQVAAEHGLSIEYAARRARYTALGDQASRLGAKAIITAHNADDQAETVLMHFLRGSGLAGLRGMQIVAPLSEAHTLRPLPGDLVILRPLLETPRSVVERYCATHHLDPRFDETNSDMAYFRNRVRHDILPMLERETPGLRDRLTRLASITSADYDLLHAALLDAWEGVKLDTTGHHVTVHLDRWRALPLALRRATLRHAVTLLDTPPEDLSFIHIENAVRLADRGSTGDRADLPGGLALIVSYDHLIIAAEDFEQSQPQRPYMDAGTSLTIDAPGLYPLPGSDWEVLVELVEDIDPPNWDWDPGLLDGWGAYTLLDADAAPLPLTLRTRQPGDRIRLEGVGTQKLSDYMINARIPADWRDRIPLLANDEHIIGICGRRVDERCHIRPTTESMWRLTYQKITEKAAL